MLKRWPVFTRFLDDGRICLTNNAAERAMRSIALGRRSWLFSGSDRGSERAAAIYTLSATANLKESLYSGMVSTGGTSLIPAAILQLHFKFPDFPSQQSYNRVLISHCRN
jgi:hypothetical protein